MLPIIMTCEYTLNFNLYLRSPGFRLKHGASRSRDLNIIPLKNNLNKLADGTLSWQRPLPNGMYESVSQLTFD
jgi:hypothetical protein